MGWKLFDYFVFGGALVLAIIPDPLDLIDFGTPALELGLAVVYYLIRKKNGGKN